ncbi:MAG: hypothetical protein AB1758_14260 [Candidatus Eremiobacterota bacterium]
MKKILILTLILCAFALGRVSADQPKMQAALDHLQAAKANLELATPDKGGHRAQALKYCQMAIHEIREGMRYDRRN